LLRQRARREAVLRGEAEPALWMLEHDPVITEGRRPVNPPVPLEALARAGIDWQRTERGGLATYHGPGQLVGYLLLDLPALGLGVRRLVAAVEQGLIRWLASRQLSAGRRPGYPGVWLDRRKIAALGLHIRRGVSMHGFAINLRTDLAPYDLIVPCGMADAEVTSLHKLQPEAPSPAEAAENIALRVLEALASASDRRPQSGRRAVSLQRSAVSSLHPDDGGGS